MIQLNFAGKRYGHKLLFEGADLLITPRDPAGTRVEWSVPLRLPAQPSAGG